MNRFECNPSTEIVVAGGGGGAPVAARAAVEACPDSRVTALYGVQDSGGSSGILRGEYDIASPGDLNKGIAAFAGDTEAALITTRYGEGADLEDFKATGDALYDAVTHNNPGLDEAWAALQIDQADAQAADFVSRGHSLQGHTYGNLLLTSQTLDKGNIGEAVKNTSALLGLPGHHVVLPASLSPQTELVMHDGDDMIIGEDAIDKHIPKHDNPYVEVWNAELTAEAREAIARADGFVLAAGSRYTSQAPLLALNGMRAALGTMKPGSKFFVVGNLVVDDRDQSWEDPETYLQKIDAYTALQDEEGNIVEGRKPNVFVFNDAPEDIPEGFNPVAYERDEIARLSKLRVAIGARLVDPNAAVYSADDACVRSPVLHNTKVLGEVVREHVPRSSTASARAAA